MIPDDELDRVGKALENAPPEAMRELEGLIRNLEQELHAARREGRKDVWMRGRIG